MMCQTQKGFFDLVEPKSKKIVQKLKVRHIPNPFRPSQNEPYFGHLAIDGITNNAINGVLDKDVLECLCRRTLKPTGICLTVTNRAKRAKSWFLKNEFFTSSQTMVATVNEHY